MSTDLVESGAQETRQSMTVQQVHQQIQLIQQVMENEMKNGEHYGTVPGCGDKKVLLKPGAEKLCLLFKMAPRFKIENVDMGNGHREVRIVTELYHIETGKFLGEGVGSCSTMESKYRYRGYEAEPTGEVVPKKYWESRDPELLGGKAFVAKKIDGQWMICVKGEKTENPDIADVYNTVLKIGKKRSQVDAVLTVTAASDLFTQDLEEGSEEAMKGPEKAKEKVPEPQRKAVSDFTPSPQETDGERPEFEPGYDDAPEEVTSTATAPSTHRAPAAAAKPSVPRGTAERKVIVSQFDGGPCNVCKKPKKKGERITKEGTAYIHEGCVK